MLRLIGAFKLLKTLTLIAVGVGVLKGWATHFTPNNVYANRLIAHVSSLDEKQLDALGIGSFVYAALFATEGIGLMLRKVWAEYLTIVITTSFIPLEIYEMVEHESVAKGVVIALNVAIVIYLVVDLRHGHRRRRRHAQSPAPGRAPAPA
jgi:uncharacterized membrane protein (DUF2068 family)